MSICKEELPILVSFARYENVVIGCTVENQAMADYRLLLFLATPVRHRLIVCAPLLGPLDIAKNFREEISLEKMAYDLCVSKYVLSRMFVKTFHCNFSKYVNGVRLNYAAVALENTQDSVTNICLDCGFESQRTFNRVFKDKYKMTPREYRKRMVQDSGTAADNRAGE